MHPSPLLRYLADLSAGQLLLWCYFLWYLVVLARYFDRTRACGSPASA